MKIAYIAHPIAGDIPGNLIKILEIIREININEPDVVPFAPYIADCLVMKDDVSEERARGIKNNKELLRSGLIDELRVYGDTVSAGIKEEMEIAKKEGMAIRFMNKTI